MERVSRRISEADRNWKGGIFSRNVATFSVTMELDEEGGDATGSDSRGILTREPR